MIHIQAKLYKYAVAFWGVHVFKQLFAVKCCDQCIMVTWMAVYRFWIFLSSHIAVSADVFLHSTQIKMWICLQVLKISLSSMLSPKFAVDKSLMRPKTLRQCEPLNCTFFPSYLCSVKKHKMQSHIVSLIHHFLFSIPLSLSLSLSLWFNVLNEFVNSALLLPYLDFH